MTNDTSPTRPDTRLDPVQEVRPFRHPYVPGDTIHEECGQSFHDHGWIDKGDHGYTVCPWDWTVPLDPSDIREGQTVLWTEEEDGILYTLRGVVHGKYQTGSITYIKVGETGSSKIDSSRGEWRLVKEAPVDPLVDTVLAADTREAAAKAIEEIRAALRGQG